MTSVNVQAILKAAKAEKDLLPPAEVERPLDPDVVDLGNLLVVESNELHDDIKNKTNRSEEELRALARDNTQILFNSLFKLEQSKVDDVIVVTLPPPSYKLPREKPVPKAKPLTKWEQYAKEKGIKKQKKTNLVWDDVVNEWVPRYGYKKAKAEEAKTWMMEIKDNADPMEDPFEKAIEKKRENKAKNELQRLRNIARAKNVKVPQVGLNPVDTATKQSLDDIKKASDLAKKSTASLGKFQDKLSNSMEKQAAKNVTGKKRKFDPLVSTGEKDKMLKILDQMSSKKPKLDISKAVGKTMHEDEQASSEQKQRSAGKRGKKGGGRGGKKGGGGGGRGKGGGRPQKGGGPRGKKPGRGGGAKAGSGKRR